LIWHGNWVRKFTLNSATMKIKFKRDTAFRKTFFVPDSFAHPAKMDAQLLIWIVEHYTETGETILDPMAGSGTTMLACTLGRNVILVELEEKFCKMMRDNWQLVKMKPQLGYQMGDCQIIQGDSRQLENILCDKIISSPPYSDISMGGGLNTKPPREGHNDQSGRSPDSPSQRGLLVDKCILSPPFGEAHSQKDLGIGDKDRADLRAYSFLKSDNPNNIGNLPYGEIDKCIFSPPFAESGFGKSNRFSGNVANRNQQVVSRNRPANIAKGQKARQQKYAEQVEGNVGNLPYGQIDKIDSIITSPPYESSVDVPDSKQGARAERLKKAGYDPKKYQGGKGRNLQQDWSYHPVDSIITSPPYEGSLIGSDNPKYDTEEYKERMAKLPSGDYSTPGRARAIRRHESGYSVNDNNIGNLKNTSYLEAMLQVYQSCFSVLKNGGLLILVTKNFIRNKQVVRLDTDTIKLCEQAGFSFVERHERVLPSQSFWRIIYKQRYPSAPTIDYEDILVFAKK